MKARWDGTLASRDGEDHSFKALLGSSARTGPVFKGGEVIYMPQGEPAPHSCATLWSSRHPEGWGCGVFELTRSLGENVLDEDYQYEYLAIGLVLPIPKDAQFQETMGLKQEVLDAIVERRVLAKVAEP